MGKWIPKVNDNPNLDLHIKEPLLVKANRWYCRWYWREQTTEAGVGDITEAVILRRNQCHITVECNTFSSSFYKGYGHITANTVKTQSRHSRGNFIELKLTPKSYHFLLLQRKIKYIHDRNYLKNPSLLFSNWLCLNNTWNGSTQMGDPL